MSQITEKNNFTVQERFNIRFVECSEPILVGDVSKTEEENKVLRDTGYPPGYNELFDCIFPPEEWEHKGKTWRRVASTSSTSRKDMLLLEKELSSQMEYWQINNHGLCQIRRELYLRYFDELIRQVCIINLDLGELFIRIRDEFKLTIEAYKNIFEYTEKIGTDGLGMNELENVVKTLEDENNLSNRTLIDANRKIENLKENLSEELNSLKAANENELNFFHKNHEAIKEQYNILLTKTRDDTNISLGKY